MAAVIINKQRAAKKKKQSGQPANEPALVYVSPSPPSPERTPPPQLCGRLSPKSPVSRATCPTVTGAVVRVLCLHLVILL